MCGIVGLVSKTSSGFFKHHTDVFTNMLRMDTIRGSDSTGVFGITAAGNIDVQKGDADGWTFTNTSQYEKFSTKLYRAYRIVVGHNRKATRGAISAHNAHPFSEGNITLVHNGTVYNQEDLNTTAEVDSHAIAHALNEHNAGDALEKIHGAFALVWYNSEDRTLNLARNSERPLYIVEYDKCWAIASEAELPVWLFRREQQQHIKVVEVPIEKIIQFKLNQLNKEPEFIDYKNYKFKPIMNQYATVKTPLFESPLKSVVQSLSNQWNNLARRGYKIGDDLVCTIDDDKEDGGEGTVYIGHPIIDGTVDENIIVRYHSVNKTDDHMIVTNNFFTARVTYTGIYQGVPVVNVVNLKPTLGYVSYNNELFVGADVANVLKGGCSKCGSEMLAKDIPKSIIRRQKDGTYMRLCCTCLSNSVKSITQDAE